MDEVGWSSHISTCCVDIEYATSDKDGMANRTSNIVQEASDRVLEKLPLQSKRFCKASSKQGYSGADASQIR